MRLIDADALKEFIDDCSICSIDCPDKGVRCSYDCDMPDCLTPKWEKLIDAQLTIDAVSVVRCENCKKSHIDGKTTHYLWCTEWGRSTDVFGYCERGEREGE